MVELVKQNFEENKKYYTDIESKLRLKLDDSIPINQVGSTAIPEMYGKNIMDILIGAKDNAEFEKIKIVLETQGYVASKKSKDGIYQFFSSTTAETGSGDIHIHLVIQDTERYNEFLVLKRYLLSNKDKAKDYSSFKKKIINSGVFDRKEYKKIKSEYVSELLANAKEWERDR